MSYSPSARRGVIPFHDVPKTVPRTRPRLVAPSSAHLSSQLRLIFSGPFLVGRVARGATPRVRQHSNVRCSILSSAQTLSTVSHSSPAPRAVLLGRLVAGSWAGRDGRAPLAIAAVVLLARWRPLA